ncbi:MAG: MBL fold metallo-hydrolase [Kordiimonadaceae bacterium]|nr:MBL fold metallo-hydrolase [Kordiimonadaceae bacterium]
MSSSAIVKSFFDPDTFTVTYVVCDPLTGSCAIIDSVLDYDASSGRTSSKSADKVISFIQENTLICEWILETHVHADHLTAAPYLKERLGGKIAIGDHIAEVQKTFCSVFNAEKNFKTDGSQFDHLFSDEEVFKIGHLSAKVIHTPGHTPACISYIIDSNCFVGDTLFMPDYGTARCDFPGGDAGMLFDSMMRILSLPNDTILYMCHDYGPDGREFKWISTVKEQKEQNIHLTGKSRDEYIEARTKRDKELKMPKLILPSVQVNMRSGNFPPAEENGITYLKIPINRI